DARHAFQQHVAVGHKGDEQARHDLVLANDGLGVLGANRGKGLAGLGVHHDCRISRSRVSKSAARVTRAWSVGGGGPCSSAVTYSAGTPVRASTASPVALPPVTWAIRALAAARSSPAARS